VKHGLRSQGLTRRVDSPTKREKCCGGVWSLKNAEGSGIGVLLAVVDMFCESQNKRKEGMKVDRGIDTFCLSRAGSIRKRHEYINPKYKSYAFHWVTPQFYPVLDPTARGFSIRNALGPMARGMKTIKPRTVFPIVLLSVHTQEGQSFLVFSLSPVVLTIKRNFL
jgi:hypothetical protein